MLRIKRNLSLSLSRKNTYLNLYDLLTNILNGFFKYIVDIQFSKWSIGYRGTALF